MGAILNAAAELWAPLASIALCAARLLPIVFLCPLFGGRVAPTPVRLGVVLSVSGLLHLVCGVSAPLSIDGAWRLVGGVLKESGYGTFLGLLASLPFEGAKMGGAMMDVFRGASSEAALPGVGAKDAPSSELLHQLLLAVATAELSPIFLNALLRTFVSAPLGLASASAVNVQQVLTWAGDTLAFALALGAPVAAVSLCIDLALGAVARGTGLSLFDSGLALKPWLGGFVLYASLSIVADRWVRHAEMVPFLGASGVSP
ncbi:MAG: EscT/YscT/HrcT family type III secretion system export apparatus protein [Myxococcaceae bacterium]